MNTSSIKLRRALVVLAAVVAASMSACGSAGPTSSNSSIVPVPEVAQTSSAPATSADTDETATRFFTALTSNDPDTMETGQEYAAPKSLAAAYLKHLTADEGARLDGGSADDADELTSGDGTWGYCPEGEASGSSRCVSWSNLKFADGKVAEFTVNGIDITKRISLGDGDEVKVGSLGEVTFVSAYQSVSAKAVNITFEFKAKKKLSLNLYGATYRGPDGRQSSATSTDGPEDLDKNSTARGLVSFKGAKPGGVVTLDLYDSDYNDHYVKIKTS